MAEIYFSDETKQKIADVKTLIKELKEGLFSLKKEWDKEKEIKVIKIKYHDTQMERVQKIAIGDWIDLRAAETVKIRKGKYKLISLGVSMEFPKGYEAHVVPRSSTFKNFGIILANSMGIIDESYCGDNDVWKFPAIALRKTKINKGDRICQFRIVKKMPEVEFVEVETLGNADRGGIGSTGVL